MAQWPLKKLLDFGGNPDPDLKKINGISTIFGADGWVPFNEFNLCARLPAITCFRLQVIWHTYEQPWRRFALSECIYYIHETPATRFPIELYIFRLSRLSNLLSSLGSLQCLCSRSASPNTTCWPVTLACRCCDDVQLLITAQNWHGSLLPRHFRLKLFSICHV